VEQTSGQPDPVHGADHADDADGTDHGTDHGEQAEAEPAHHLGYARLDTDRRRRTGDPEVVLGTGKTPDQVVEVLRALHAAHPDRAVLATRLEPEALDGVRDRLPEARIDPVARAATLGPLPEPRGTVCVVTAGTSDLPVAAEAVLTAQVHGAGVRLVGDVGVAGLHRLFDVREELVDADCLVVVAGMEGALPSVVGGLVGVPLVAVPTSVGYGASFGGVAALLAMLNSCAPGVTVVNVDNGFGAGVFAARVARNAGRREHRPRTNAQAATAPAPMSRHPGRADDPNVSSPGSRRGARVGWVDSSSGVAGDMLLGALVDAGVPLRVLQDAVDAVLPGTVTLRGEQVRRGGLRALRVHVEVDGRAADEPPDAPGAAPDRHPHRAWSDVRALLAASGLGDAVRERAVATFARLAAAEAAVHGGDLDRVELHEVGAVDAVADVVGAAAGLHHLGLVTLTGSPVAVGGGTVRTGHGRLPVPVPAVAALLTGTPTVGGPVDVELATPTGAAVLATAVDGWGSQPPMTVSTVGVGAGSRDLDGHPNVLRLLVGTATAPSGARPAVPPAPAPGLAPPRAPAEPGARPLLLQTNVDDLDPRLWPGVLTRLLEAGASDAWLTPILMKKGRPAHTLAVLVRPDVREPVERVVFAETTTIGLRVQEVDKVSLDRGELVVAVDGHAVRVKTATHGGQVVNRQPEYDDVVAVAGATGRAVKDVLADAAARARDLDPVVRP